MVTDHAGAAASRRSGTVQVACDHFSGRPHRVRDFAMAHRDPEGSADPGRSSDATVDGQALVHRAIDSGCTISPYVSIERMLELPGNRHREVGVGMRQFHQVGGVEA